MDDEIYNDNVKFVFVRLVNGDNLMCQTDSKIDDITKLKHLRVIDPIQIFSFKMPYNGAVIEKYIMQSWTPFSSSTESYIPIINVLFVGELKGHFVDRYLEYITDPESQQLVEEGQSGDMEEGEDEEDMTIEEYLEQEETQQQDKKWLH